MNVIVKNTSADVILRTSFPNGSDIKLKLFVRGQLKAKNKCRHSITTDCLTRTVAGLDEAFSIVLQHAD